MASKNNLIPGKLYRISDGGKMIAWSHGRSKRLTNTLIVDENHILHFLKVDRDYDPVLPPCSSYLFIIQGKIYKIYNSNLQRRTFEELA